MILTHFGHASVLVDTGSARILIDPGTLSSGFEGLRDLTAVLVTHEHPDHLDLDRIGPLLAANPEATLYADASAGGQLQLHGVHVVRPGDKLRVGGSIVTVLGGQHADIVDGFPGTTNSAFDIDQGALFHPGDSFQLPTHDVDVLALPLAAPWLKLADVITYLGSVRPRVAVPVHQADLVDTGTSYYMVERFAPEGTSFVALEWNTPTPI